MDYSPTRGLQWIIVQHEDCIYKPWNTRSKGIHILLLCMPHGTDLSLCQKSHLIYEYYNLMSDKQGNYSCSTKAQ